jgi:hypothetical protein
MLRKMLIVSHGYFDLLRREVSVEVDTDVLDCGRLMHGQLKDKKTKVHPYYKWIKVTVDRSPV